MKRGVMKKLICSILILTFVFSLVGCNKKEAKGKENTQLAKQNVYSYEEIPFEIEADNYNVRSMIYLNDKIIFSMDIYIQNDEMFERRTDIYSVNIDGSDLKRTELQEEEGKDDTANSYINQLVLAEDGSVIAVEEVYKEDYSDPDNPIYKNWSQLKRWNADGTIRWIKSLEEFKSNPEDYFYVSNMFVDDEGNVSLMCSDSQSKFLSLDSEGNVVSNNKIDNIALPNISNVFMKIDKTFIIMSYDENNKMYASSYDPTTNTIGEKKESLVNIDRYYKTIGTTTDFVLSDNLGVYTYNIGDTELKPIMDIINSDLAASGFSSVCVIDDTHFIGSYMDLTDYNSHFAMFTKVNPKDIPDKEILTLGVSYMNSQLSKRVIDFNKESEKYRITVRDYSGTNDRWDFTAINATLNNEIISGNMPDMLSVESNMPISDYIGKGLLADIDKLIEQDEELSKKEYMENVFQAFRINDTLYSIVPSFTVVSAIANSSIVGDRTGWTMEDMLKIQSELPEESRLFTKDTTRSMFIQYIMGTSGSDFVDLSTGKCKFDSDEFVKILEFAKTLPEEQDDSDNMRGQVVASMNYEWMDYESQFRNNQTIVSPVNIYSIGSLNRTINGYFGGDFSFVGYPNENSDSSVIQFYNNYIISSKSANIDGAWEFLRYYLTDEYQETLQYELPVNKEMFMKNAQQALERPYYTDGENNKVEYDDSIMVNGEEVVLEPMTQEQIDKAVSFIQSVNRQYYYNSEVTKIIGEEAESFFSGQKDAKSVVEIIQNRVQLYVNESR